MLSLEKTTKQAADVWHIIQHSSRISPGDMALFDALFTDMVKIIKEQEDERKEPLQIRLPM